MKEEKACLMSRRSVSFKSSLKPK